MKAQQRNKEVVMLKLKWKYNVNELQKKQLTVGMFTDTGIYAVRETY